MSNATPVLGFPSKGAAVWALTEQGKKIPEIAQLIGGTVHSAEMALYNERKKRQRAGDAQAEPTPGLWTPEKLAKAHRLFGKTIILIAEALQVPAAELLAYGLKGVIPPMGEKQRVAQLIDEVSNGEPKPEVEPPLQLPAPAPSREDDEAELARLEAEERSGGIADSADPGAKKNPVPASGARIEGGRPHPMATPIGGSIEPRFRLKNELGEFLHESESGMTTNPRLAWSGRSEQLEKLLQKKRHLRKLDSEPV